MKKQKTITVWDRQKKQFFSEQVYGEAFVHFLYSNGFGCWLRKIFLIHPLLSRIYGLYQNSFLSKWKIPRFIKHYQIPMHEFVEKNYTSFNDFFVRQFKPNARTFILNEQAIPAFAEGRYVAYTKMDESITFPIKGKSLNIVQLMGNAELAQSFLDGPAFIARLCPTDYHRFHFPDDGKIAKQYTLNGVLESVNPWALEKNPDIFLKNERVVSILESQNFGKLAYIEIGALCVGKILQTYTGEYFKRGAEKGYFLFGGSTIVLLGEKNKWIPNQDILTQTQNKCETLIRLGEAIATRLN